MQPVSCDTRGRERRWTRSPLWSGSLWLANTLFPSWICVLIVLTFCAAGWEELGFSTNRIFILWSEAEMSLSHIPAFLVFLSFWMNVKRQRLCVGVKAMNSTNFICLHQYVTFLHFIFEAVSAPRLWILFCIFPPADSFKDCLFLEALHHWGCIGSAH